MHDLIFHKEVLFNISFWFSNLRCCRGWWARWHVYLGGSSKCCWELYYWCKDIKNKIVTNMFKGQHLLCIFERKIFIVSALFQLLFHFLIFWRLNIQDLRAMTDAAKHRPVILINARLKVWFLYSCCKFLSSYNYVACKFLQESVVSYWYW